MQQSDQQREPVAVGLIMPDGPDRRPVRLIPVPGVKVSVHENGIVFLCVGSGQIFTANHIVQRLWQGVLAGDDLAALGTRISSEYGISFEQAQLDIEASVNQLTEQGLLRREPVLATRKRWLALQVWWELLRYDVNISLFGFGSVLAQLERCAVNSDYAGGREVELETSRAMSIAMALYWKPVKCLQRSVVKARLLRRRGIPAELVIGYRPMPFFSHAWVEVQQRAIDDPQSYSRRLLILDRVGSPKSESQEYVRTLETARPVPECSHA
jgi:hypothetical protein